MPGAWEDTFAGADALVLNHAQIGAIDEKPVHRQQHHGNGECRWPRQSAAASAMSSTSPHRWSIRTARDFYTETKKAQEKMVVESGLPVTRAAADADVRLVRPQASRLARPLHAARFRCSRFPATAAICASRSMPAISAKSSPPASEPRHHGQAFNITGQERIDYIDLMRAVKGCGRSQGGDRQHPLRAVSAAAEDLCAGRQQSAFHRQPTRSPGDARRVRGYRLAGHLRRHADAACRRRSDVTFRDPTYSRSPWSSDHGTCRDRRRRRHGTGRRVSCRQGRPSR